MFKSNKEKREEKNYLAYNSLKIQLSNCPNLAFNQYVLSFAKSFIKNGDLKVLKGNKNADFILDLRNIEYGAKVVIRKEHNKIEVIISIYPIIGTDQIEYSMIKKVVFDDNLVILTDKVEYKKYLSFMEKSLDKRVTFSVFRNDCQINKLGDNVLVYRIINNYKWEHESKKTEESLEVLRVNENKNAIIKTYDTYYDDTMDSENTNIKNSKANNVFATFESFLKNETIFLEEKEDISFEDASSLIRDWEKENSDLRKNIDIPLQNGTHFYHIKRNDKHFCVGGY